MSTAELELYGVVDEWQRVVAYLGNETSTAGEENHLSRIPVPDDEEDWRWEDRNDEWSVKDDDKEKDNIAAESEDTGSLASFKGVSPLDTDLKVVAVSPAADIMFIGGTQRSVFLSAEWENGRTKFVNAFDGDLTQNEGELITCAVCIPLVSKKVSSPDLPDWTVICVGFTTGHIRMYTEQGNLLETCWLHNQTVKSINVKSFHRAESSQEHDQLEEVMVFYENVVVVLDGFGLFQTLRASRNRLARGDKSSAGPLAAATYKKWAFDGLRQVSEGDCVGLKTPCLFDQFFTASVLGGLNARCKPAPTTSNVFIATSKKPYISFYYAQESQAVVLTDIAYSVASKLKSSLVNAASGWLGFGSQVVSPKPKDSEKMEPAVSMISRFGLQDPGRHGTVLSMSPCRKLCVLADNLARVILIDNERGVATRIWKGYRDAQCAWINIDEPISRGKQKQLPRWATLLVIYAKRRGKLEVYTAQSKIATFNVTRFGRLLSCTYGMMGLNNVPVRGAKPTLQCVLIDHLGQLLALNIPFHLTLDKANIKSRDLHLIKTLQKLLRHGKSSETELLELLKLIEGKSTVNQAFRLLLNKCRDIEKLSFVLDEYIKLFCDDGKRDLSLAFRLQALVDLYKSIVEITRKEKEIQDKEITERSLHMSSKELKVLQEMKDNAAGLSSSKTVTFKEETSFISLDVYFSCFVIEFDHAKTKQTASLQNQTFLNFNSGGIEELANFLFDGCFNTPVRISEWKSAIRNSGLSPSEVLKIALKFWHQTALTNVSYPNSMHRLYAVVAEICDLEGIERCICEFNVMNKWWESIRQEIAKCPEVFQMYEFAAVCRAIAIDLLVDAERIRDGNHKDNVKQQQIEMGEVADPTTLDCEPSDWESMSLDLLKWNILLKQLEDLSILTCVLTSRPVVTYPVLPVLRQETRSLSVVDLLDKGPGCIAELVGKWLTTTGIEPGLLNNERSEPEKCPVANEENVKKNDEDEHETRQVLAQVELLRENFSVSLSSSIILVNYSFEYAIEWNKSINDLEYLKASIKCINCIPHSDSATKEGMLSMVWNTFLSRLLPPLLSIHAPANVKPLDKPIELNSEGCLKLIRMCADFFEMFMKVNLACDSAQHSRNSQTKSHWRTEVSAVSLVDVALSLPRPNYNQLALHYQLMLCAFLIHYFNIRKPKLAKAAGLFDTKSRRLFFKELHSEFEFPKEVDLTIINLREEFLCLVISGAIRSIPERFDSYESDDNTLIPSEEGVSECFGWIEKSYELARDWELELDSLRIIQVCEFYSNGLDNLGAEIVPAVRSKDTLGAKLLVIAGMRVNYIRNQQPERTLEIMSSVSTNFSNWLTNLDYSLLRCLRFSKESINEMALQIRRLIPMSNYDYRLTEELHSVTSFL